MRAAEDYTTIRDRMAELAKEREDNKCTCLYEHGILVAASASCPVHPKVDDVSGAVCGFPTHRSDWPEIRRRILEEEGYRLTGKRT